MKDIKIKIYSHNDDFIDLLYDSNNEFDGQLYDPKMEIKANGQKTLTFTIPAQIYDRVNYKLINNPRWDYVINHYKIRVIEDDDINEFVMQSYSEERSDGDIITVEVACNSLAEFELSQLGYTLAFNENTLRMYADGDDPNDTDSEQIGSYDATIDFWEKKVLGYYTTTEDNQIIPHWPYGWEYEVQCDYTNIPELPNPEQGQTRLTTKIYETENIINYDSNNDPVYATRYTEKQRIISIEKSNIWNIESELCGKFEVWPEYKITYNDNGRISSKKIILRNDISDDSLFTIRYSKNERNISREVDGSQVVTKMFVNNLSNENVDSGVITIADNDANFMRENYILGLDWYLGEGDKEDLSHDSLLDEDLTYTFSAEQNYARTEDKWNSITVSNDTKGIIDKHKELIRKRNFYLEDISQQVSEKQEEYTNLCSEKEFKVSSRDSAQENYNNILDEWAKCPQDTQVKTKDRCYIYDVGGTMVISFSEKGIKVADIEDVVFYVGTLYNLCYLSGSVKHSITDVSKIKFEVYETEQITGCVTSVKVVWSDSATAAEKACKIVLGDEETYSCISIDLKYNPLFYYNMLRDYWKGKANEYATRIEELGLTPDEGAKYITGGTNKLIITCYHDLKELKSTLYRAKLAKESAIRDFEEFFHPYIKEGYWEDTDYGVYENNATRNNGCLSTNKPLYSTVRNQVVWTDEKVCFKIPNREIITYSRLDPNSSTDYSSARLRLYDILDIDILEVFSHNPQEESSTTPLKTYVKGTDFQVEFGYVANHRVGTEDNVNKLVDINSQQEEVLTSCDDDGLPTDGAYSLGVFLVFQNAQEYYTQNGWAFNSNSTLFIKAKARGSDNYVFAGDISSEYLTTDSSRVKAYTQMERLITLPVESDVIKENIILTSVELYTSTGQLNYKISETNTNFDPDHNTTFVPVASSASQNIYKLSVGSDYYCYKTTEDNRTVVKIHLYETTNCPLILPAGTLIAPMPAWFNVVYKQDITSKFYYNDALDAFDDFKQPQVTYNVSLLDISKVLNPDRDYSCYKPKAGTRVPIYDKEMKFDGISGFIESVSYNLFEPQNTSVEITNYKDKFEDLFQRVTQATVAIQSKEYKYDRTTKIVNTDNGTTTISTDILQQSLLDANTDLSLSKDTDVKIDKNGITLTNQVEDGIPGQVRLTGNGIFISNSVDSNNNYEWTSALTSKYINASLLRSGHLDTRSISIWNDSEPRFTWNENGLYAYGTGKDGKSTDYNTFVMYNQEGLKFRKLSNFTDSITLYQKLFGKNWTVCDQDGETIASLPGLNTSISAVATDNITKIICSIPISQIGLSHKYYYRVTTSWTIPQNSKITIYAGIDGYMRDVTDTITNNKFSGIIEVDSSTLSTKDFKIIYTLSQGNSQWTVNISNPIVVDITDSVITDQSGIQNLNKESLDEKTLSFDSTTGLCSITNTYGYQDIMTVGWDGIKINAQGKSVTLTGDEGLQVFEKSSIGSYIKRLRLGSYEDTRSGVTETHYGLIGYETITEEGISYSERCFSLDEDGLYLKGKIDATAGGTIGGFKIGANAIYRTTDDTIGEAEAYNNEDTMYFGSQGISLTDKFSVSSDGQLIATDASITGVITASSGTIGGFTIGSTSLSAGSGTTLIKLSTDNGIKVGDDFSVSNEGKLTASKVVIDGKISATSGSIGGFTINSSSLYNGRDSLTSSSRGVYVGTDGISVGQSDTVFVKLKKDGGLIAQTAEITALTSDTIVIDTTLEEVAVKGYIGAVEGSTGSTTTYNIGVTSTYNSIILDSSYNIRLSSKGTIYLDAGSTGHVQYKSAETGGVFVTLGA